MLNSGGDPMKTFISLCLICAFLCGCNKSAGHPGVYERNGTTVDVNDQRPDLYNYVDTGNGERMDDFGFVRHVKSPVAGQNPANKPVFINREKLADMISRLVVSLPDVTDCSTLVTSKEALVAYTTGSRDRRRVAEQVKRTAMSVVPRQYEVYVTDDPSLRKEIENFAGLDSDSGGIDKVLNLTIQRMIDSTPQGTEPPAGGG
ncbi:MAG: sporulation protein [Caldibacillus debilis]|nr:sporulation protein [Bacillaceae bacterium]MBY6270709.1 sporulation protein [Bacillaceae bacterium]REJ18962.1 MAG: sporulation protein [Caldibacillus debilis]REJ30705.1 MAG: sporulation protein [Caldibacillus debilis]